MNVCILRIWRDGRKWWFSVDVDGDALVQTFETSRGRCLSMLLELCIRHPVKLGDETVDWFGFGFLIREEIIKSVAYMTYFHKVQSYSSDDKKASPDAS